MKLSEALAQLPADMIMIDLPSIDFRTATVAELLERAQRRDEDGYEVREERRHYGRRVAMAVGLIDGMTIYRQQDAVERA